jgi:hypothetical protein
MNKAKTLFHYISYVQYPLLGIALLFVFKPYFEGFGSFWQNLNQALIFAGLGISFSTLQDTRKTQNNFSKKVWESPSKGKAALAVIFLIAISFMAFGLYGLHVSKNEILKEVSFGILVLGIGYVGILKSAIEMFENHRKDMRI